MTSTSGPISGELYIHALADYIRKHESAFADFVRTGPAKTGPSWTAILTLGVISSEVAVPAKAKLVLSLDCHHLYFLLLKFDELAIPGLGPLDLAVTGLAQPMVQPSWDRPARADRSDAVSLSSAMSSFSIGSAWWGGANKVYDQATDIKYVYSSCTKLPAIRLTPFAPGPAGSAPATLARPVADFEDCPPAQTAVPLYAFKNLSSLVLEDLDPRGFVGWDVLSTQLRSLELHRSGIEDLGELVCDAVVDDLARRAEAKGKAGEDRRRRRGGGSSTETTPSTPTTEASSTPLDRTPPATPVNLDDGEAAPTKEPPSTYPVPPRASWHQLRHLSLSNNSLTFIPSAPLLYLPALTSLDLSSNLLIGVPAGLANLVSLRFLNLSDNMIDSLAGIAKALGNVAVVNLAQNRIENLSGLDRLFALERLDVRANRIQEALEVSRLARLPHLREVHVERNPFSRAVAEGGEDGYRVKCFGYFAKEGNLELRLDGTRPGMGEQRGLDSLDGIKSSSSGGLFSAGRRASVGAGAHKVAEEAHHPGQAKFVGRRSVTNPGAGARSPESVPPVPSMPPALGRGRVDTSDSGTDPTLVPSASSASLHASPGKPKRRKPKRIVDLDGLVVSTPDGALTESGPSDSDRPAVAHFTPDRSTGHARYPTSPHEATPPANANSLSPHRESQRERISQSTYEPPTSAAAGHAAAAGERSGEALRKKIEALRNEVGESWLSVLGEREMAAERAKGQSDESGAEGRAKGGEPMAAAAAVAVAKVEEAPTAVREPADDGEPVVQVVKIKKKGKKKKKANGDGNGNGNGTGTAST